MATIKEKQRLYKSKGPMGEGGSKATMERGEAEAIQINGAAKARGTATTERGEP